MSQAQPQQPTDSTAAKGRFRSHLLYNFPALVVSFDRKIWSVEQLAKFLKQRAQASLDYSKAVEKLVSKAPRGAAQWFEESTASKMWLEVLKMEEDIAKSHKMMSDRLLAVVQSLTESRDNATFLRQCIKDEGSNAIRQYEEVITSLDKSKASYFRTSAALHDAEVSVGAAQATGNEQLVADKKRKELKLQSELKDQEATYKERVAVATEWQKRLYDEQLPVCLDSFENLYYLRSQQLTSAINSYLVGTRTIMIDRTQPILKAMEERILAVSSDLDVAEFIEKTKTYNPPPTVPVFELAPEQLVISSPTPSPKNGASSSASSTVDREVGGKKKSAWQKMKETIRGKQFLTGANAAAAAASVSKQVFGSSVAELMARQKAEHPDLDIPFIAKFLAEGVLKLGGETSLGIFRISGSLMEIERYSQALAAGVFELPSDVNVVAATFKQWLRSLPEPLLPESLYPNAVSCENPKEALLVFHNIPEPARTLAGFVVKYIQHFLQPDIVAQTSMDLQNLASIFSPCFSRSPMTNVDLSQTLMLVEGERRWLIDVIRDLDTTSFPSWDTPTSIVSPTSSTSPPVAVEKTPALSPIMLGSPHIHDAASSSTQALPQLPPHPLPRTPDGTKKPLPSAVPKPLPSRRPSLPGGSPPQLQ